MSRLPITAGITKLMIQMPKDAACMPQKSPFCANENVVIKEKASKLKNILVKFFICLLKF